MRPYQLKLCMTSILALGACALDDEAGDQTDIADGEAVITRELASAVPVLSPSTPGMAADVSVAATFGPYIIVADHSGRCLDVIGGPAATGNGVRVQQWDCLGPAQTNQLWYFTEMGDGSYNIWAAHSGKCLDVVGGTGAIGDGTDVQQFSCLGPAQTNQRWFFDSERNIWAYHSGRCLDIRGGPGATGNGARAQQWGCFWPSTANQRWSLYYYQ